MTQSPTPAEALAGNMVAGQVACCLNCKRLQVVYDPALPRLSAKEAATILRDKGWTQRKGAWYCPECTAKIPARRERTIATSATHDNSHLRPIK